MCCIELVVSLDADNEFLKDRVINLPQTQVTGTHNTEEGIVNLSLSHITYFLKVF